MDAKKFYDIAKEINDIEDKISEVNENGVDIFAATDGYLEGHYINDYLSDAQIAAVEELVIGFLHEATDDLRDALKKIKESGDGN